LSIADAVDTGKVVEPHWYDHEGLGRQTVGTIQLISEGTPTNAHPIIIARKYKNATLICTLVLLLYKTPLIL
jgi:hypothetical protein